MVDTLTGPWKKRPTCEMVTLVLITLGLNLMIITKLILFLIGSAFS